jgi:hypothetical protein
MPLEAPLSFFLRHYLGMSRKYLRALAIAWRFHRIRKRIEKDPAARDYRDEATG